MLKQFLSAAVVVAAMSALTSCDSDNKHDYEPNPDQPKYSAGAYFLNQGNYYGGGIEGGLYSLDYNTGMMANNIFKAARWATHPSAAYATDRKYISAYTSRSASSSLTSIPTRRLAACASKG